MSRLEGMHASQPWYREGLRFQCTGCGDCCTGGPGFVWVDEGEVTAIADHLGEPVGAFRLLRTRPARGKTSLREHLNGDCEFLDPQTRRCRIYPVRPKQCRTWPFWQSNVETEDAWKRTCESCPGAGTGPLVSLEAIEASRQMCDI